MKQAELLKVLFSCPLFDNVDIGEMDFNFQIEKFKSKENLFKTNQIGVLLKGTAGIKKQEGNKKLNIRNIKSGDIFGVASLFQGTASNSLIISNEECIVAYIKESELKEIFRKFPEVNENYIKFLTNRINFLNKKITIFSADSTEQKLLMFLNQFAEENKSSVIKISPTELSRRLSVGRTSLYRALDSLQANKIILRENNQITIL